VSAPPRTARPRSREFLADTLTPVGVFERLGELSPFRFLFESVTGGEHVSRFSFLGAAPRAVATLWPDRLEVEERGTKVERRGDPLAALRATLSEIAAEGHPELPFTGGWVGFFGFDLVRLVERLPNRPPDPFEVPVAVLGRFDHLVAFDHARQRVVAVANEIDGLVGSDEARADLERLAALLTSNVPSSGLELVAPSVAETLEARPSIDPPAFEAAVERARELIAAGDIFQVVLARRFTLPGACPSPVAVYRALRAINPSPYMVLLETPTVDLIGASPEMLVRKVGRRVETRPIAGTRPRGRDEAEDRALAAELLADPKERAEHLMLVDLGRNDLGRIARAGSVAVGQFMEIERYSHVMHIVSDVEAEMAADREPLDALLACFPAGTVSGAPKIRAMEIIDELEPEARGPYAGAVGYLSYSGDLDTCISIRTLVVRNGEVSVSAGAGIVADSDPAAEERETRHKAAALLAAVELARRMPG
jgi:anthranilate synthase component 1